MISNYVKRGLLSSPVKKQYSRDHVAYLSSSPWRRNVLSLDALACFRGFRSAPILWKSL